MGCEIGRTFELNRGWNCGDQTCRWLADGACCGSCPLQLACKSPFPPSWIPEKKITNRAERWINRYIACGCVRERGRQKKMAFLHLDLGNPWKFACELPWLLRWYPFLCFREREGWGGWFELSEFGFASNLFSVQTSIERERIWAFGVLPLISSRFTQVLRFRGFFLAGNGGVRGLVLAGEGWGSWRGVGLGVGQAEEVQFGPGLFLFRA